MWHKLWQKKSFLFLEDHIAIFRSMAWCFFLWKWSQIVVALPGPHEVSFSAQKDLLCHQAIHWGFLIQWFLRAFFLAVLHQDPLSFLFCRFYFLNLDFSSVLVPLPRLFVWSSFCRIQNWLGILFVVLETFAYNTKACLVWEFTRCFLGVFLCHQLLWLFDHRYLCSYICSLFVAFLNWLTINILRIYISTF